MCVCEQITDRIPWTRNKKVYGHTAGTYALFELYAVAGIRVCTLNRMYRWIRGRNERLR